MISDARLEALSDINHVGSILGQEISAMAKELLAHRKAWSEPVEYQYRYHNHGNGCFGEWCRLYSGAQYEHMQKRHSNDSDYDFRTLYRKPSSD